MDRIAKKPGIAWTRVFDQFDFTTRWQQLLTAATYKTGPFDLVTCRNVLIYFLPGGQAELLSRVVDRIAPGGWLILGEAEWPAPALEPRLEVVDRPARLFRVRGPDGGDR